MVGEKGQAVQISVNVPSQYICANREQILPDWKEQPSLWVLIVLQRAQYELLEKTPEIEADKERLRANFLRFALDVAFNLRDRGYLTDVIDPRTGYPLLSRPGKTPHDDTAVVNALLGYPIIHNRCRVLVHPQWGMAVYPSIVISIAPPTLIEWVAKSVAALHGWKQNNI